MSVKNVSNLAASVQARLQNHARATKRPFQELLQYYAMERFLYRLSMTSHHARDGTGHLGQTNHPAQIFAGTPSANRMTVSALLWRNSRSG